MKGRLLSSGMADSLHNFTNSASAYPQVRPKRCGLVAANWHTVPMPLGSDSPRFLTLADVAETLNISDRQTYALVRRGELPAIRIGGRGQWRVEATELEQYIAKQYTATKSYIDAHPFGEGDQT